MTSAITGGISMASGLMGMIGGLRNSRQVAAAPLEIGPGIGPEMDILAGQEQQAAARSQAELIGREAVLAYEDSQAQAAQRAREGRAFKEQQALKFATSGVTLAGSPLGVLEETAALNRQEVDAINRRGENLTRLYEIEGLRMLRQGSAAAFGGFANALQTKYQFQLQGLQNQYDTRVRQEQLDMQNRQMRTQAFQSGLAGLGAGVQGVASLFRGRSSGGGGGYVGGGMLGVPTPIALTPHGTL